MADFHLRRRYPSSYVPPVTPPVVNASTTITLQLTFATAAQAQAASISIAPTKYNKKKILMYDQDDGFMSFYNDIRPLFDTLTYADGAGATVKARANGAIYGLNGYNGTEKGDGSDPGSYTYAQMKAMVALGWDFSNHSYTHNSLGDTYAPYLADAQKMHELIKAKVGYLFTTGITPSNYKEFTNAFLGELGYYAVSTEGANGNYPIYPQYAQNAPILQSALPLKKYVLRRVNLDAFNATGLTNRKADIDTLATQTEPAILRWFSHGVNDKDLYTQLFQYAFAKIGADLSLLTLREFAEYRMVRSQTALTTSVSGSVVNVTLNQAGVDANIRWRDLTLLESSGAAYTCKQSGASKVTYAPTIINVYNSDVVPTGGTVAGALTSDTTTTPTTPPAEAPTTGRITGALPYDSTLAYHTSSANQDGIAAWFNGVLSQNVLEKVGYNYFDTQSDFVFNFRPEWDFRLSKLRLYDSNGSSASPAPELFYRVTGTANLVSFGTFTGSLFNAWQELSAANVAIDQIVLRLYQGSPSVLPTQIEFVGEYTPYTPPLPTLQRTGLSEQAGINGFWYDFSKNTAVHGQPTPEDPENGVIDATLNAKLQPFMGVREYIRVPEIYNKTPETGVYEYRVSPSFGGGAHLDTIGKQQKKDGKLWLPSIINNFPDYVAGYPAGTTKPEVPQYPYGADRANPETLRRSGEMWYEMGARWGDTVPPTAFQTVSKMATTKFVSYDPLHEKKFALNIASYYESLNEMNATYFGKEVFVRPDHLAVYHDVCVDGCRGTMSGYLGLKNAHPSAKYVMGALYNCDVRYMRAFLLALKARRGLLPNGQVNWGIDVINIHFYHVAGANETGIAPEYSVFWEQLLRMQQLLQEVAPGLPVWLTETGYSVSDVASHAAAKTDERTRVLRAADFTLRMMAMGAMAGVQKTYLYDTNDHGDYAANPTNPDVGWDQSCGILARPARAYVEQATTQLKGYVATEIVQNAERDPAKAYVYRFTKPGSPDCLMLWMGTQNDSTGSYNLTTTNGGTRYDVQPTGTSLASTALAAGTVSVFVSETPCFVLLAPAQTAVTYTSYDTGTSALAGYEAQAI